MAGYEILEHTADIGVRAKGMSLETCFEQAAFGVASIMGILAPGPGETVHLEMSARDTGALLVDFLNEILYLHETRNARLAGLVVHEVDPPRLRASLTLGRSGADPPEGTAVKAVTYHQLRVERSGSEIVAEVYLDV